MLIKIQLIAKLVDSCASFINILPKRMVIKLYSFGRSKFMEYYYKISTTRSIGNDIKPQLPHKSRILWGLTFNLPLMNCAGMFKNGEGYAISCLQGAGGYIGGTSTYNPREGNTIDNIKLPFLKLVKSQLTLNCLGVPNLGDEILSQSIITPHKTCPIGWSLIRSPDYDEETGMENLLKSLWLYHNNSQIDFLEINESCPNVAITQDNILKRLAYIGDNFLVKRKRHLPVVVKLSPDIECNVLESILDILFKYKFDGVNIGNTSKDYINLKSYVAPSELALFEYFINNFGGGIGGRPLKMKTFNLCKHAVEYYKLISPQYEFHVIRSGGIDSVDDIYASDLIGVSMNQWYSGYFDNYSKYGDSLYSVLFDKYMSNSS
ncbi:MAG: hypothetical protein KBD37_04280 [Burkholderiales bacterium]|nr:hypothetical protein [Burkholderiales bacterium]